MKKVLFGLFLLISFGINAQTAFKVDNTPTRFVNKFGIPVKATVVPMGTDSALIWLDPTDSSFNWAYKGQKQKAAKSTWLTWDSITNKPSVLIAGNNLADVSNVTTAKSNLGLGNVDNTSDANKPVSTAQAASIATKQATLVSGSNIKTINSNNLLGSGNISVTSLVGYTPENVANKNANNGYAGLDPGGKISFSLLPSSLMIYKGTWNASTNSPSLSDGTGTSGWIYIVSTGGTVNTGSGSITYSAGDYAIHNGSIWQRSVGTNNVASVNGQQGVVSLSTTNISEGTNQYFTSARARTSISLTVTSASGAATYNNTTGVLNIPTYTLSGLGGQPQLNGTGFVKATGTTISYDNSTYLTTSGTAANSTLWNSQTLNLADLASLNIQPLVYDVTNAQVRPATQFNLRNFLDLGSYAYRSSGLAELSGATFTGLINTTAGNGLIVGGTGFAFSPSSTRGSAQIVGSTDRILAFGTNGAQDAYIYSATGLTQFVSTPDFYLVVGGSNRLSVAASNGEATFTNKVSAPTAAFTGIGINATPTSGGTSPLNIRFLSTGSDFYVGTEGSTGGGFFGGSSAYASVFYSGQPIQSIVSGTKRLEVNTSGISVTGTVTTGLGGVIISSTNTKVESDGSSLYLKAAGNTYLNTAASAYVDNGGMIYASATQVPNGGYYKAIRNTGSAAINVLGIESGTDNTVMVASNMFKLRNTGTGDAANLFTVNPSGNGVFTGSVSAANFIGTSSSTSSVLGHFEVLNGKTLYIYNTGSSAYTGLSYNTTNGLLVSTPITAQAATINNLAGTGDRMVVANSSGVLSTQAIPTTGLVANGVGTGLTGDLDIATYTTPSGVSGYGIYEVGGNITYNNGSGTFELNLEWTNENNVAQSLGLVAIGSGTNGGAPYTFPGVARIIYTYPSTVVKLKIKTLAGTPNWNAQCFIKRLL